VALLLREAVVEPLLDMGEIIEAVGSATRDLGDGSAQNQPRRRVFPPGGILNVMFASAPGAGFSGVKTYSVGGGTVRFLVSLFDLEGRLQALIEADRMGAYRTGAATGVAARALAPPDTQRAAVIGTGWQARTQVLALATALPLRELRVYGRDREKRETFAAKASESTGVDVVAAASAPEAVDGAGVVVTITTSGDPVLEADWVRPGTLVVGAGSNYPNRAELPAGLIQRAGVVAVDQLETARMESGDLIRAEGEGSFVWEQAVELGAILAGSAAGRSQPSQTVVFESHGLALWDIAAGAVVLARARERGAGEEVRLL
jgi:ornithine cyclodeaminase/alanine dehydrogenase-like protein (mu-crystallin family)